MRAFLSAITAKTTLFILATAASMFMAGSALGQSQSTAADLSGTVTDPTGAVVAGATVTARNPATNIERTVTADSQGTYTIIGLPPGDYEVTAEAATFKKVVISGVKLAVGQTADLTIKLELGAANAVVNVSANDVDLVETSKTNVSNVIDQARIENLPINERSATGFALTLSTVGRDNGRPIGPAPTSGLNIGGQRGRSTQVNVDGADFTDNSVNASRSTVSQEAVQEYQVTTNSYMPEFGRATGGIVNVVTKRGTSDYHGNMFGFFRHKSIQSRNAFAPVIDGDPNKKPPYTRAQFGATLGGPLPGMKKVFFFGAFEGRRRQESGFFTGDIFGGATQSFAFGGQTFTNLTAAQVSYVQAGLLAGGAQAQRAAAYLMLASAGGQTSINGSSTLVNIVPGVGVPTGSTVGQRFLLSGAPVPLTRNSDGQYVAFRPLGSLPRVYPISEKTSYGSLRIDVNANQNNQLNFRFGYNPSIIRGIQDESQNQTLGQNDYSRTGIQKLEDFSFGSALTTIFSSSKVNDLYYNYGRRVAAFDSRTPSIAIQIAGTAFMGSNPFSPVARVENRHQLRDSLTWSHGSHTFKFGGDLNWIYGGARFDLNFPGIFSFGPQSAGSLVAVPNDLTQPPSQTNPAVGCDSLTLALRCPAFTATQAYGLGYPGFFLQGFGNPISTLGNKPVAVFAQDSWKVHPRLTLNFGVRYDYEFTKQFATTGFKDPLTGIYLSSAEALMAQDALNITQGYPRDANNIAPRFGFAWDVMGSGKTIIRGAVGRFFDHPALASGFISDIGDGSQQQQTTLLPLGTPSPTQLLNALQAFQGTVIPGVTPGVAPTAQYLNGYMRFNPQTFTGFGPVLPIVYPISKDFKYPDAIQANFGIERMIGRNMSVSASWIMVQAHHLNHPVDVNAPVTDFLRENFRRFAVNNPSFPGCTSATPNAPSCYPTSINAASFFYLGAASTALTTNNALYSSVTPLGTPIGLVNRNNSTGQIFVNPIAANFFRPSGPNYFFVAAISGGALNKAAFDSFLPGSVRSPGPISAFGDVSAQMSDGNSSYNAMNLELKKRFSSNMQFLASYTWAHSIDDSSDLQTLLKPQNNRNMKAERSDSLFDQRHRFVFSGVINSPDAWRSGSGFKRFLSDFSFAPIVEFGSGRPFNILAVGDSNGDFQTSNERPTVLSDGTLCATGVDLGCLQGVFPADGSLPRNHGITHNYFSFDARLTRRFRIGERASLDIIAEGFNLFNRFNEAAGNPFYSVVNAFNKRAKNGRYYSQPTAAFDPRQFQIGIKLGF